MTRIQPRSVPQQAFARLADAGYDPVPVDTGEFLKSGGSVFCLKQFVY